VCVLLVREVRISRQGQAFKGSAVGRWHQKAEERDVVRGEVRAGLMRLSRGLVAAWLLKVT
jgi:hypothetical protein